MRLLAKFAFPLAVVALILLAIPGFALFLLSLFGGSSRLNSWLEKDLRLSYGLALPPIAAIAMFLVPALLILLYFLKLRRKPLSVPSTFLWKKSVEDLHVNSLFQWLRRNVLLLLQLLAVLALLYGILAPRFFAPTGQGRRFVVLVDNSASMGTTDVAPNRLEVAKLEALAEIEAAGEGDAGMVIAFNSSAEIKQSFTSNKQLLKQAVRGITPTLRPTRLEEALALADSLANPTRSTEDVAVRPDGATRTYVPAADGNETDLHLFSDGRFADAPDFAVGKLLVKFHAAGKPGPDVDNVGLVNFTASRDEYDPTRLMVFARALNYRATKARAKLEVQVYVDGKLTKAYEKETSVPARLYEAAKVNDDGVVTLPGKDQPGEASLNFEVPELDDTKEAIVRGKLVENKDAFPADDEAFLVVGVIRRARVLIVGPPNKILDAFFDDPATKVVADVTKIPKEALSDRSQYLDPARAGGFDLVIFDRCAPAKEEEMPLANTLFLGQPPPPWKPAGEPQPEGKTVEKVPQPAVKGWTSQHGMLRYLVGLHEVGVFEALRIGGLPARTPKLMEGDRDLLLLFTLARGPHTDAVLTFPILNDAGEWNTNWPLLPSFPLFLRNALYTLGNIRDATAEENVQPGAVKTLRPGPGVDSVKIAGPSNLNATMERGGRADFPFADTDRLGVYQATWAGGDRRFAVNLLDPDESNLQPRDSVQIGATTVSANQTEKRPKELWKWLVLAALAVVLLEWYVYNRRVYV